MIGDSNDESTFPHGNSNDESTFPHKLLLTDWQVLNILKAFANHSSVEIKFSKT